MEFKLKEFKKFIVGVIVVLPLMQLSRLERYATALVTEVFIVPD